METIIVITILLVVSAIFGGALRINSQRKKQNISQLEDSEPFKEEE